MDLFEGFEPMTPPKYANDDKPSSKDNDDGIIYKHKVLDLILHLLSFSAQLFKGILLKARRTLTVKRRRRSSILDQQMTLMRRQAAVSGGGPPSIKHLLAHSTNTII